MFRKRHWGGWLLADGRGSRDRDFSLSWHVVLWAPWALFGGGTVRSWSSPFKTKTTQNASFCRKTNSAEQSTSSEANSYSASREIPRRIWNPKVHYYVHKSRHWYLSRARWIQSVYSKPASLRSIVILSSHLRSSFLPRSRLYPKVSGLAAWSESCKWHSFLPLSAVVSLFCESV
jgi:hypothetical protein